MTDRVWVPERWDRGRWDQAHWNGKLGFNAQTYAVTIATGNSVLQGGHLLVAATSSILVSGIPVICRAGRGMRATCSDIVVTGIDISFTTKRVLPITAALGPESGQVVVTGIWANLVPHLGPGVLNFGIPVRLGQW